MDMNAYCIAVYGIPLGYHSDEPRATPLDGETISQTNSTIDPWKEEDQ